MRVLEVSRYKNNFADHQLPFVTEQGESLRAAGCEVEYFLVKGNYIKAVKALMQKIREFHPDIIHSHYGLSAITAELQSLVPVVTTFHNGETHRWYVNLMSSLMSLRAKHVIYVAPHIRQKSYFKAKKYSIIPCGVTLQDCFLMDKAEARKKLGWSDDKKYIIFGGAFDNLRKNYPLLHDAIELLVETKTEINTVSEINIDKNFIKEKWIKVDGGEQFGDIVCFEMRGLSRSECVLRMNASDVFVLPTKNEGSPQALKEAMACNCPIVATDVADIKHLLGNLPGHYILPNMKGTPADWEGDEHSAKELADLLNQALAFKGQTKGRERIVELGYTNEQVAKRIVKIYEHILNRRRI